MGTTIVTPNEGDWALAIKNLYNRGELTLEQMENCLHRLQVLEIPLYKGVQDSLSDISSFTCRVCGQTKGVLDRSHYKKGWCAACEDELIGEMM